MMTLRERTEALIDGYDVLTEYLSVGKLENRLGPLCRRLG